MNRHEFSDTLAKALTGAEIVQTYGIEFERGAGGIFITITYTPLGDIPLRQVYPGQKFGQAQIADTKMEYDWQTNRVSLIITRLFLPHGVMPQMDSDHQSLIGAICG
jgi:hypothetical protein